MEKKKIINTKISKFLFFLALLAVFFILGRIIHFDSTSFRNFFEGIPLAVAGLIFIVLYVVLTFLIWFGPKDVLRVSSALVFGAVVSTILVFVSEMINAVILFLFSRKMGQDYVKQRFKIKEESLNKAKQAKGFLGVFAVRINPLFPFRLMDLAAGLSPISLRKYFTACFLASPLRIFWLQYILAVLGTDLGKWGRVWMASLSSQNPQGQQQVLDFMSEYPGIFLYSFFYLAVVVLVSLIALVVRLLRSRPRPSTQHIE